MSQYVPTIGLEIHAELKTRTKMFCDSKNDPDEDRPNANVCPICLAHPGTLPVINREAVRHVLRVGVALGGTLADYTEFDRKNYFYPDLPKGYQISQYEHPLVSGGSLAGVSITRVHLEEDTASSMHEEGSGTTIDYNRAGVPLMELVSEPVIESAEEAGRFARELQTLLRYLNASDANMEKGEMRVEANISVSKLDGKKKVLGTKVEVKNLNSFRTMERAIAHEIQRQTELLESGGRVTQETRGWDEGKQSTFSQRIKEESADYRYFPDPDLPSLKLSELEDFQLQTLEKSIPELPAERRERYLKLGLQADDADLFVKVPLLGAYFDGIASSYPVGSQAITLASNYLANDLMKMISSSAKATKDRRDSEDRDSGFNPETIISARNLEKIINLQMAGKISSRTAKDLLAASVEDPEKDPEDIATEKGLFQVTDATSIGKVVEELVRTHEDVVKDFRGGKTAALQFLVGQGMKALKGAVDPTTLRVLIEEEIAKSR